MVYSDQDVSCYFEFGFWFRVLGTVSEYKDLKKNSHGKWTVIMLNKSCVYKYIKNFSVCLQCATNESTIESDMRIMHKKFDVLNGPYVWDEEFKSRMIKCTCGRDAKNNKR